VSIVRQGDPGWLDTLQGVRKSIASVIGAHTYRHGSGVPTHAEIVESLVAGSAWDRSLEMADIEGFVADYMRELNGDSVMNQAWASLLDRSR
jgi:hypothetical protein